MSLRHFTGELPDQNLDPPDEDADEEERMRDIYDEHIDNLIDDMKERGQ
jgi:hypothetical protein